MLRFHSGTTFDETFDAIPVVDYSRDVEQELQQLTGLYFPTKTPPIVESVTLSGYTNSATKFLFCKYYRRGWKTAVYYQNGNTGNRWEFLEILKNTDDWND
jgi:hypothetical protein